MMKKIASSAHYHFFRAKGLSTVICSVATEKLKNSPWSCGKISVGSRENVNTEQDHQATRGMVQNACIVAPNGPAAALEYSEVLLSLLPVSSWNCH